MREVHDKELGPEWMWLLAFRSVSVRGSRPGGRADRADPFPPIAPLLLSSPPPSSRCSRMRVAYHPDKGTLADPRI